MKISVIIPSYKPGTYLWECLDALCNQTLLEKEYELIIVLNGCNQPYASQIQEYIRTHQNYFILLRQTDEPGVSNARNIGIDESHGDYIVFVDDDDIVSSTYLENLLKVSTEDCVGCSTMKAFHQSTKENIATFLSKAYERCKDVPFNLYDYRQFLSPTCSKMIHISLIGDTRFQLDMKKSEDSVFCFQISPRIKDMKLASPDAVYYLRLREGSATRKKESCWSIIKEHLFIEYKYFSVWIKNPFRYNLRFFLSRVIACGKNCLQYIKR
mgnify:CR=1 FL=1